MFFPSIRAPSPTKRKEDDKSKQRGKEKSGATKEGADKDRGREKNRTKRNASSGSSRSEAYFTKLNFSSELKVLGLTPGSDEGPCCVEFLCSHHVFKCWGLLLVEACDKPSDSVIQN